MKKILLSIWVIPSILLLSSCGKKLANSTEDLQLQDSKIINGKYDSLNHEKNVVAVLGSNSLCTGTIIHPYLVLTAAHCVENNVRGVLVLNNFSTSTYNPKDLIPAHKTIKNKKYDRGNPNAEYDDIGLIILKEKIKIDSNDIVPLMTASEARIFDIQEGDTAMIVGYGKNENHRVTGHRRTKEVKVMDSYFCSDDDLENVYNFNLGADSGDSGGPAFINKNGKKRQIGIASTARVKGVSFGVASFRTPEFCRRSNYTNVTKHLGWIRMNSGFFPGVSEDDFSEEIEERYDFSKKLVVSKKGEPQQINLGNAALLKVKFSKFEITQGYGDIDVFLGTYFCPTNKKCKKMEESGTYSLDKQKAYDLSSGEMAIATTQIKEMAKKYGHGKLEFRAIHNPGILKRNITLGTISMPSNLGYNYSQRNLDKLKNLKRFKDIEDSEVTMRVEIELDL